MIIKFSPPLAKDFGSELEISLKQGVRVRDLIKEIAKKLENFDLFIKDKGDDIRVHFMLTSKEKLLKMDDEVTDKDVIEVFLPVSGGGECSSANELWRTASIRTPCESVSRAGEK